MQHLDHSLSPGKCVYSRYFASVTDQHQFCNQKYSGSNINDTVLFGNPFPKSMASSVTTVGI